MTRVTKDNLIVAGCFDVSAQERAAAKVRVEQREAIKRQRKARRDSKKPRGETNEERTIRLKAKHEHRLKEDPFFAQQQERLEEIRAAYDALRLARRAQELLRLDEQRAKEDAEYEARKTAYRTRHAIK
jgi:hypothetical protein